MIQLNQYYYSSVSINSNILNLKISLNTLITLFILIQVKRVNIKPYSIWSALKIQKIYPVIELDHE